ncbi:ABC transporter permease [Cellulomonas chengniuliangii]|uniref:ABC transporter permease n=1 Tax=Cellulomonas chengniuliangii TaxID=2968084 RepID=A0ABY5KWZ2_9CELL|nr:ABC transporter permease [Cellulomonas chengniuliangii]MCC2309075.1 ABC transporter permease [Cellulomonas chengniuliangii]UUI74199.1 ABC transporter permease [Cellulomonas chengniuliangii]
MSLAVALGEGGGPPPAASRPTRTRGHRPLLLPGLAYLALFFVAPVAVLLATSLYVPVPGGDVGQYQPALHGQNYVDALAKFWPQLVRSFGFALMATLAALAIGYPMAYAIAVRARGRRLLQGLLLVLVVAPFFTSFILRTIAWKQILADDSFVVAALHWLHLLPPGGRLTATPFAVVCGLTYNFLPFMVLPIYASLERLDPRMLEAGADLYASPFTTFRTVTLPLSMPGVVGGTLLTFIPASGDYVNSSLLGNNTNTSMIGQVIDARFFKVLDYPTAAALSVVLMVAILVLVGAYVRRSGTEELL